MSGTLKETFYFSHDRNARHDPKILVMRSKYGYEGYGWYWAIIETLREQKDYKLNITDKFTVSSLAIDLQISSEQVDAFLKDCINDFDLLKSDGTRVWSNSLLNRMKKREQIRKKRQRAGKLGALAKHKANKDWQMPESNMANAKEKDDKLWQVKEKKVKESKENKKRKTSLLLAE